MFHPQLPEGEPQLPIYTGRFQAAEVYPSTRALAVVGGATLLLLTILLGSSLVIFIDIPSILLVPGGTLALVVGSFGVRGALQAITTPLELEPDPAALCHSARFFALSGAAALGTGWLGVLIGLVQMLQQMDDLTKIGPALAVSLLTAFYGLGIALPCLAAWSAISRRIAG